MPEIPDVADFDAFLPNDDRDDRIVTLQMPRHVLRGMARDAKAHRQAQALAAAEQPTDTELLPGEAGMTGERRDLSADAPADRAVPGDPYREAERIFNDVLANGGLEKEAAGAALNSVVNAAARGDQRVIIRDPQRQFRQS